MSASSILLAMSGVVLAWMVLADCLVQPRHAVLPMIVGFTLFLALLAVLLPLRFIALGGAERTAMTILALTAAVLVGTPLAGRMVPRRYAMLPLPIGLMLLMVLLLVSLYLIGEGMEWGSMSSRLHGP